MRISVCGALSLLLAVSHAQERCDAPYPNVYCNTTDILAYETSSCRPYHIFVTRGSDEPYSGRLGNLTKEICVAIGSQDCGFENIEYPAKSTAWGKDEWCKSAAKGAASGQAQMKAYSQKCPTSKLVLLGFSQGAAVAQDILGGGGGHVFDCDQAVNPALDASSAPGSNVVAAVTFGAVVRSRNQPFTIGDGKPYDGRRARTSEQLQALNKYASVLLDYCHYGDPMCAVGSEPANVYVHLDYFLEHNEEVIQRVSKLAKAKNEVSSSNTPEAPKPSQPTTSSITGKPATTLASPTVDSAVITKSTSFPPSVLLKSATTPLETPSQISPISASTTNSLEGQIAPTGNNVKNNAGVMAFPVVQGRYKSVLAILGLAWLRVVLW